MLVQKKNELYDVLPYLIDKAYVLDTNKVIKKKDKFIACSGLQTKRCSQQEANIMCDSAEIIKANAKP